MLPLVEFADRKEVLRTVFEREATFDAQVQERVDDILDAVRERGDAALRDLTARFDGVELPQAGGTGDDGGEGSTGSAGSPGGAAGAGGEGSSGSPGGLAVEPDRVRRALDELDAEFRSVLEEAAENVRRFHERQRPNSWFAEEGDGVVLGQRIRPIERVGVYVPGGTAAYPSTVLMCTIPAQVAGVGAIHLVSPPGPDGRPHPYVLAAAALLDIRHVYPVGGAQAIGALAFGTESVPAVDKIVGPGNAYVAAAKRRVFGRVDIDSVAGPSEIVVLADGTADPEYVAADLIAQAEHDERASAVLVTPSRSLAEVVGRRVETTVPELERAETIRAALTDFSGRILVPGMEEAVRVVDELAPEHLELLVEDPWTTMTEINHAGAIFLGPHSTEPVGDYWAGPNHVLPTGGTARYASALCVGDFVRSQSVIAYGERRLERDGSKIERFAREEGLTGHARAVRVRLDRIAEDRR